MYAEGKGVPQSHAKAAELYCAAADRGMHVVGIKHSSDGESIRL
jgi:TPR repeat protein